MEDLALITALNHSSSFCEHLFKFRGKKTIKMLFTSSGPSVLGKTVPSVLSTDPNLGHSFYQYGPFTITIRLFYTVD